MDKECETIHDLLAEYYRAAADGYEATEDEWAHFGRRAVRAMQGAAGEFTWLRDLLERNWSCPNWGEQPDGHYGPCGKCDMCLAAGADFVKEIYDALREEGE